MKLNEAKSKSYSVHRVAQIILERTLQTSFPIHINIFLFLLYTQMPAQYHALVL